MLLETHLSQRALAMFDGHVLELFYNEHLPKVQELVTAVRARMAGY
jgi:hypothetical protein